MLSERRLQAYRRMTPRERFEEALGLLEFAWRVMEQRPQEWVDRYWEHRRKERHASAEAFLRHFYATGSEGEEQ